MRRPPPGRAVLPPPTTRAPRDPPRARASGRVAGGHSRERHGSGWRSCGADSGRVDETASQEAVRQIDPLAGTPGCSRSSASDRRRPTRSARTDQRPSRRARRARDAATLAPPAVAGQVAGRDREARVEPHEDLLHRLEQHVRDGHVCARKRVGLAVEHCRLQHDPVDGGVRDRRLDRDRIVVDGLIGPNPSRAAATDSTPEPHPTSSSEPRSEPASSSIQSRVVGCAPVPKARPGSITTAGSPASGRSHGGPIQSPPTRAGRWNARQASSQPGSTGVTSTSANAATNAPRPRSPRRRARARQRLLGLRFLEAAGRQLDRGRAQPPPPARGDAGGDTDERPVIRARSCRTRRQVPSGSSSKRPTRSTVKANGRLASSSPAPARRRSALSPGPISAIVRCGTGSRSRPRKAGTRGTGRAFPRAA